MKKPHEITPILKNSIDPEDFYQMRKWLDPAPISTLKGEAVHRVDTGSGTIFFIDLADLHYIVKVHPPDADTLEQLFAGLHVEELLFCCLDIDNSGMSLEDRLLAA